MKPLETAKIPVAPQLEPIPTFNRDMQNVHLFLNSAKLNTLNGDCILQPMKQQLISWILQNFGKSNWDPK